MSIILGKHLHKALIQAGLADENTRRVVIDIPVDGFPVIYRESLGDARVLDIVPVLSQMDALKIRGVPAPASGVEVTRYGDSERSYIDDDGNIHHGIVNPPEVEGDGTL